MTECEWENKTTHEEQTADYLKGKKKENFRQRCSERALEAAWLTMGTLGQRQRKWAGHRRIRCRAIWLWNADSCSLHFYTTSVSRALGRQQAWVDIFNFNLPCHEFPSASTYLFSTEL